MLLCGGKPLPAGCPALRWRSAQGPSCKPLSFVHLRGSSPHCGFHQPVTTSNGRWIGSRALEQDDQPPRAAQPNAVRGAEDRDSTWDGSEGLQPSSSKSTHSRGGSRGRGTRYTSSTSTPPTTGTPLQRTGSPRYSGKQTSRRELQAPEAKRRPWRSHSAPPAPTRSNGLNAPGAGTGTSPTRRRKAALDLIVQQAIKADLPHVVRQIGAYRQLVEQNTKRGQQPATFSADIVNLCISLSSSITRDSRDARERRRLSLQQDSQLQEDAKQAAEWLLAQTVVLLRDSHTKALSTRSADGCLPLLDLCAFAFTLHDIEEVVGNQGAIRRLAQATAKHATLRLQLGDMPPSMQAWKDLLYGLTMAGLVVSVDRAAEREGVESIHLQQLLDAGAQHLPAVLRSQAAEARNVSLTLLAYAYAGYTGDLGPVIQALASNLEGCLQDVKSQECSNTLWALGKLSESWQHGAHHTHVQSIFSWALGKLGEQIQQRQRQLIPQHISNAVYGCALAGHMEGLPQFLALVCQHLEVMEAAIPQHWANTVWGIATLYDTTTEKGSMQEGKQLQEYGRVLLAGCVQRPGAMKPQDWSNSVWAAAKLGCVQEGAQLLSQLTSHLDVMRVANSQNWSNTLWAAATLYEAAQRAGDQQLAQPLQRSGRTLINECMQKLDEGAVSQTWSNLVWAAATLRLYKGHMFERAMQELSAMPSAASMSQVYSNSLWACAICAYWDSGVQQLLGRVRESDLAQFTAQGLANTAWAWAVLACLAQEDGSYEQHEQCFQQVAESLFKEAASRPVGSFTVRERRQLHQAHLFAGHLGIPGLPGGQVLDSAMQAELTVHTTTSRSQQAVSSALTQMGYTTQLEGLSPDGLMRADIVITALPDGSPCSIAVEYDGPPHYVAELSASNAVVDRLDGRTRLRNLLLSQSFPNGLVCIYWRDWEAVKGDREIQEEYLSKALAKVVRDEEHQLVQDPAAAGSGASSAPTAVGSDSPTTSARSVRVRRSHAGGGKRASKGQVLRGKGGASEQQHGEQPSSPAAAHQQAAAHKAGQPNSDDSSDEGGDDEAGTGATNLRRKAARKTGPGEQSPSEASSTASRAATRRRSSKQQLKGEGDDCAAVRQ